MDSGSTLLLFIIAFGVVIAVIVFRKAVLSSKMDPAAGNPGSTRFPKEGVRAFVSKKLRPVGVINVESIPYEATSEGEFIEPGTEVVVIGRLGGRALVRKIK